MHTFNDVKISAHVPAGYSADFQLGESAKVPYVFRLQIPLNFRPENAREIRFVGNPDFRPEVFRKNRLKFHQDFRL